MAVLFQQLPVDGILHIVDLQPFVAPWYRVFLVSLLQTYHLMMAFDVNILPQALIYHAQDPASEGIAVHVAHDTEIAVNALNALLDVIDGLSLVEPVNRRYEVPYRAFGRVYTPELHDSSRELDSLGIVLYVELIRMQLHMASLLEHLAYLRYRPQELPLAVVYDIEVIDIPAMILESKITLQVPVEQVQEKVGKELTGQVTNGQSTLRIIGEQGFVRWQVLPFLRRRPTLTVQFRTV